MLHILGWWFFCLVTYIYTSRLDPNIGYTRGRQWCHSVYNTVTAAILEEYCILAVYNGVANLHKLARCCVHGITYQKHNIKHETQQSKKRHSRRPTTKRRIKYKCNYRYLFGSLQFRLLSGEMTPPGYCPDDPVTNTVKFHDICSKMQCGKIHWISQETEE